MGYNLGTAVPTNRPHPASRFWCRLRQAPAGAAPHPRGHKMSIEDDPKKSRDAEATPEWHRARAKDLRRNGFTKMAEEHEQIARTIERQRRGDDPGRPHRTALGL